MDQITKFHLILKESRKIVHLEKPQKREKERLKRKLKGNLYNIHTINIDGLLLKCFLIIYPADAVVRCTILKFTPSQILFFFL